MADPTAYTIGYSFTGFQASSPDEPLPATSLDAELQNIQAALASLRASVMEIRRSDGSLNNGVVTVASLDSGLLTGIATPSPWVTATAYAANDTVFEGPGFYIALVDHTSGTFATDLLAGKWEELADFTPPGTVDADVVTFTPAGTIAASNAQAAIEEVATDAAAALAALSGTLGDLATVDTVDTDDIEDGAVTAAKLDTNAVGTSSIVDASVTGPKIGDNAVALSQMAHLTRGSLLFFGASGAPTELAAGTSGYFLKTLGAGADPAWAALGALGSLGFTDLVYTGSSTSNTTYPVGSTILVKNSTVTRNTSATIRLSASDSYSYLDTGAGAALTGTWRARGWLDPDSDNPTLFQRVA